MRNKALGIPKQNSLQNPCDKENKKRDSCSKSIVSSRSSQNNDLVRKTPIKTVSSKKEDADVAVEINITSSQNIQVK